MGLMDKVREGMRSFLQLDPPSTRYITIQETLDYEANAFKNRIWYRGDSSELSQLYETLNDGNNKLMFWAARPTPGIEIQKRHTGLPAIIVDTISGIVADNLNDLDFKNNSYSDVWEQVAKENNFDKLLARAISETLYIGDGAFKVSLDKSLSDYPILEFFPGDKVEYTLSRGRIKEIIFKSIVKADKKDYELREIYGIGYVNYELRRNGNLVSMAEIESLADLKPITFGPKDGKYMMAVPVLFFQSDRWEGRGKSIFDKKVENFDAFDESWSQWMDALRAGRTREYIPENLIPRDPKNGSLMQPNPFDNRFIQTEADMAQNAQNKIQTESPEIKHESYIATYTTALDQCLQGVISPSTLGIDVKKLDNAEAQREKEKVTLYTRNKIVEPLQADIKSLVEVVLRAYYEWHQQTPPEAVDVDVTFGDYANPSFESQVETIGKARTQGIMSTEAAVDELYGDSRDESWKKKEVARIKTEQGIMPMDEPAMNLDREGIDGEEDKEENEGIAGESAAAASDRTGSQEDLPDDGEGGGRTS